MKKSVILGMMCVMACSLSAQTYKNGTWFSLLDETEHTMNTQGDYETGGIFAPTTGTLNVIWKYGWIDWVGFAKKIDTDVLESADNGSTTKKVGSLAENTSDNSQTTETFNVSRNINWIKFDRSGLPTHKVILKHIDIPLAKHILFQSGANGTAALSHDFGIQELFTTSEAYHVNLRSFLTAGDISITSSMPTVFRVGAPDNTTGITYAVGANACASANGTAAAAGGANLGKISNYGFDIYFTPEAGGTFEAVITLTDGVSTAKVNVSGSANKLNQTISWEPEQTILTSDTIGTATASSGLEVTYAFAPEGIVSYEAGAFTILSEGIVTITASQSGNGQYNAAQPLSKTITIYPAQTHYAYERAICDGDAYTDEHFAQLTEAGIYCDTIPTVHGGDSIISLSLTVNPLYYFEDSLSMKVGAEETWQHINLAEFEVGDTTLVVSYEAATTCDSTYVLHLHVQPRITTYGADTVSLCAGETYVFEGKTYRRTTTDSVLLAQPNQFGGDSIVVLVVNVYQAVSIVASVTITEGDIETWQGIDLSTMPVGDTTLVAEYTSVHGCDSTYTLYLTVEEFINTEDLPATWEDDNSVRKVLRNGTIYIRKGDAWYDLMGRKRQ